MSGKHIHLTSMADPLLEYSKLSDDRSPESTIDNSTQVSSVLSTLSGYGTLYTTQTLSCPLSLIAYPLNSVHLEYYLTLRHSAILWRFVMPGIEALLQQFSVIFQ